MSRHESHALERAPGRKGKATRLRSVTPHVAGERKMSHSRSLFDFGSQARDYDLWYKTSFGSMHDRVQKKDVTKLLARAERGERLLDVGCGTGHWSAFFAEMGYKVTGIDIEPKMIEKARIAAPGCSFQVADVLALPFKDGSFDVVAAMATLEFLPEPSEAISEIVRCARPGGRLLIGTLNRLAKLNRDRVSQAKEPYVSAHLFSPDEVRQLLAPLGDVRIAASPSVSRKRSFVLHGGIRSWLKKESQGPFIIAEVQL